MKAIFTLLLLLVVSGCDNPKKEAQPESYREQGAVDAAHSGLSHAVEGLNLKASTAHNEWMRVEAIKDELKREQREPQVKALTKELTEATAAKAEAEEVYSKQVQGIEAAVKSGRALLIASAKPKSLKELEAQVKLAEQLLSDLQNWRKRADDAGRKYLETPLPEEKMEAQRAYYKIAKEHWDLK